jgi:hypothetical protein
MSRQDLNLTFADAAALLKEAQAENGWAVGRIRDLEVANAGHERFRQSIKIAQALAPHRGDDFDPISHAEKLASSNEDLDVLERAVALQAENPKLAHVQQQEQSEAEKVASASQSQSEASARMNSWLLNGASENPFGFPV